MCSSDPEEKVRIIWDNLKAAQSRQKSYYDKHHQEVHYEIGDKAYLRVSPLRGVRRFGIKGKLAPRYVGPFTVLAKRGDLSYQLELPSNFPDVHDVFHVSQLRRCFKDPIRGVDHEVLDIQDDLTIASILSASWMKRRGKPATSPSSFSRSNGPTIPKKKPHGSEKLVFVRNTPPSSLKPRISGRDSCKGGRFVTALAW